MKRRQNQTKKTETRSLATAELTTVQGGILYYTKTYYYDGRDDDWGKRTGG